MMESEELSHVTVKSQLDTVRSLVLDYSRTLFTPPDANTAKITHDNDSFNLISNFESLLVEFQSLLIWEKPGNSAIALTVFTCLYWLVVLWSPRFLFILATIVFCYNFYEMWVRFVWPEIRAPSVEITENWTSVNPKVLSGPEIHQFLFKTKNLFRSWLNKLIETRRQSPGIFCCGSLLFFSTIYVLGCYIPGVVFAYFVSLNLFLLPGFLLYVIPDEIRQNIFEYFDPDFQSHGNSKFQIRSVETIPTNELFYDSESSTDSSGEESSISAHLSKQLDDNFFDNSHRSKYHSSSDDLDDFEMISDSELTDVK